MKTRIRLVITMVLLFGQVTFAQNIEKPKLVVGIVIDQMRAEYLYRFQENYSENGFSVQYNLFYSSQTVRTK